MSEDLIYDVGAAVPSPVEPDTATLVERFLSRRSANTRRAYESDLRDFADHVGAGSPVKALDMLIEGGPHRAHVAVMRYRDGMAERGLSPATRNRRLSAIRSALKLGRQLGLLTWTLETESEKVITLRDTRGPGEDAYRALLKVAGARDTAMLRLMHDLGLRRGEVVGLDVQHLDLEKRTVAVLGKGRNERELLTLPAPTAKALAAWLEERGEQEADALFVARHHPNTGHRLSGRAVAYMVKRVGARAGVGDVRPHGLRHTGITTALERTNGNISKVARFSRHASIETVKRYDDNRRDAAGEVAALVAGPDTDAQDDGHMTPIRA